MKCARSPFAATDEVNNLYTVFVVKHCCLPVTSPHDVTVKLDGYPGRFQTKRRYQRVNR